MISVLPRVDGDIDTFGDLVEIRTANPTAALLALTHWAVEHETDLDAITVTRPSLEDIYLELTDARATANRDV